jgi:hypothetical protein
MARRADLCHHLDVDTTVDAERGPSRAWRRWAALIAVAAAVAAALLFRAMAASSDGGHELTDRLTDRVVTILEGASLDEHAEHGHKFEEGARVICVAEVFGFDPPGATTIAEVKEVYAHHACAEVGTGFPWPDAIRVSEPMVLRLTTQPATVVLPSATLAADPDADYADKVRTVIPAEFHDQALDDPGLLGELRSRFDDACGSSRSLCEVALD